jgi:hypothetical protein
MLAQSSRTPWPRRALTLLAATCAAFSLSGCNQTPPPKDIVQFYMEASGDGGHAVTMPISGLSYSIVSDPFLGIGDVVDVELAHVELGNCLMFQFNELGARELYRDTVENQGRRIVMFINNKPMGVHFIDSPIQDGRLFVWANEIPDKDQQDLVLDLQESVKRIKALKK